jgi:hypothetical protein
MQSGVQALSLGRFPEIEEGNGESADREGGDRVHRDREGPMFTGLSQ